MDWHPLRSRIPEAIRSSSLSRRYGVAVSPSRRACCDLFHRVLECGGGDVMAFVHHDEAVGAGKNLIWWGAGGRLSC
jgi:hypothetical protein